jgi:predicted oxidoreductase (fatty acid repression mutant protein)
MQYNPIIDEKVAKRWNIPSTWNLTAQLVFGGKLDGPAPAEKPQVEPLEKRVIVPTA